MIARAYRADLFRPARRGAGDRARRQRHRRRRLRRGPHRPRHRARLVAGRRAASLRMPEATRPWQHVARLPRRLSRSTSSGARPPTSRARSISALTRRPGHGRRTDAARCSRRSARRPNSTSTPQSGRGRDEEPRRRRLARAARRSAGATGCRARRRSAGPPNGTVACRLGESARAVSLDQIDAYGALEPRDHDTPLRPPAAPAARR